MIQTFNVTEGKARPLGAEWTEKGVNFALFSRHGSNVTVCIYALPEDSIPIFEYSLNKNFNRTGDIWHCFIEGLQVNALYAFKVDGNYNPEKGHRFNKNKLLLDPYAKALTSNYPDSMINSLGYDYQSDQKDLSFSSLDSTSTMPKCIVINNEYDWQGDRPLNYPLRVSVLYEVHVRGLSALANVEHPGTYRGVIEMIPYLKSLGVTSIEFLPVQEFNELENDRINPKTGQKLSNYWGYSTIAFFAPKASFASSSDNGNQVKEFKDMVRELHKAGLEVILDIVFNHSAEGNELGPTINFRGLDNTIYYILDKNRRYYKNYSGCGNTLNCNHPVMRSLIIDCLHYWVIEMHVDGFRFDLGSILGRDQNGNLMENPPVLEQIAEDPILRNTKIIAEAWDAGGAYQVGWFPGGRWAEWNDRYRDDIRRFWRGDNNAVQGLATRITGSSDLYLRDGRKPFHSINFITSHDGFTMNDLVSFNGKHNNENGEDNRDGHDSNFSYNYGFEGLVKNPAIQQIRERQVKNFFSTLLLSLGTPMILGGDEFRRSQKGNNNAYCQNNPVSWLDWEYAKDNQEILQFVKKLIAFRLRHHAFLRPEFYTGKDASYNAIPDISWFNEKAELPDWAKIDQIIAFRIDGSKADVKADRDDNDFYIMFNAKNEQVIFQIPKAHDDKKWFRVIDTGLEHPRDFTESGEEEFLRPQNEYVLKSKSFVLLLSK